MFKGCAMIKPKSKCISPFWLDGVWLYKPDTKCWYVKGQSFPEGIVVIPSREGEND